MMTRDELKMECLRLALGNRIAPRNSKDTVEEAEKFFAFVTGTSGATATEAPKAAVAPPPEEPKDHIMVYRSSFKGEWHIDAGPDGQLFTKSSTDGHVKSVVKHFPIIAVKVPV